MQKQQPNQPTFKLSGNNSQLTLLDGTSYEINIEAAFINLLETLPNNVKFEELRNELLSINDHITANLPDDVCVPIYKSMHAQINAYANFFHALVYKLNKGGSND